MKNDNSCNLLIDADDTLWENNIYYERVVREAQSLLQPFGVDPRDFRLHLNEKEGRHILIHGYGTLNFKRSFVEAFADFLPSPIDLKLINRVEALALDILEHPLEILEGVPETLLYLSCQHSLFLVTKGDMQEQERKIEASSLRPYFSEVEILPEKNEGIYRDLLRKYAWEPEQTWMIGNSPRSDINPAISAGMNAIHIPHTHTWDLEHEEPVSHPRLLRLEKFADLRCYF